MAMAKTHNDHVQDWRGAVEALKATMDDLLGKEVRVSAPWAPTFTGKVTRINSHPSSYYGKSLSVKPDDPKEAGFGSASGVMPHQVEVLD